MKRGGGSLDDDDDDDDEQGLPKRIIVELEDLLVRLR